jgi:hypothetical protein
MSLMASPVGVNPVGKTGGNFTVVFTPVSVAVACPVFWSPDGVTVVICPVGVTVTVDAEPLLMAAAPAFSALELMIAWVADAVPVSPTSVFQIRCSLSVSAPREAGGGCGGGDTGGGVVPMVLLVVIFSPPYGNSVIPWHNSVLSRLPTNQADNNSAFCHRLICSMIQRTLPYLPVSG